MSQLDLDLDLRPCDCSHKYGFISLAGQVACYHCDACHADVISYVPNPPEDLGYVSAIWKDWNETFPRRYPNLVREAFALIPKEEEA